jgi:hypothetical protein
VRGPSGLVAALGRDSGQHGVPARSLGWIVCSVSAAIAIDAGQLAIAEWDIARRPSRQEATVAAGLAGDPNGAALRAFQEA